MLSERTIRALEGVSKASRAGVRVRKLLKIIRNSDDLWMRAYANIYSNEGAITRGVNDNTLDGFGQERVVRLMRDLRDDSYRPVPVRRTYILKDPSKPNGKKRPLGIPTGDDKIVQEVVRIVLEAVYEPIFTDRSHGFRPDRSCHTALQQIVDSWKGTKWVCEVDIAGYFDNIDHETLLSSLEKRIDDTAFIKLVGRFLKAGYLEDWKFNATYSGTPQGGVVSPILANIYLHELDELMEAKIQAFNKGKRRKVNKDYHRLVNNISNRRRALREHGESHLKAGQWLREIEEMRSRMATMPSLDMNDEGFKRLHYVRYADDFLIGIVGTKADAAHVMGEVRTFVEENLKLTISEEKSRMGALEEGTTFLGYGVRTRRTAKRMKCVVGEAEGRTVHATKQTITSHIHLSVPAAKLRSFAQSRGYGTFDAKGNDIRFRTWMINLSDYEIVAQYNAELRGFANYYALAPKYYLGRLEWMAHTSLYKTLARKHDVTWAKVFARMRNPSGDGHELIYELNGERRNFRIFRLKDRKDARTQNMVDRQPNLFNYSSRSELLQRLAAKQCEYCKSTEGSFEVHHVRKLADLDGRTTAWQRLMIQRKRKTLVLCQSCHIDLHRGTLPDARFADRKPLMESRMR